HADAHAVHHNRNRDRGGKHHRALPERRLEQVGGKEPKAEQRIEIAQTTAGIDDLQLVLTEIDDIAGEIDRHTEEADEPDAEFGGNELQSPRQLRIDEIG